MPEAILKYRLPEENEEFKQAQNAWKYKQALEEIAEYLRQDLKYKELKGKERETIERISNYFYKSINEWGIELWQ